jgi:hypothetical protein
MYKSMVIAASAVMAMATLVPAAQAGRGHGHGGMRMGSGSMMRLSSPRLSVQKIHHHHHRRFRPIYVAPATTVTQEEYSVKSYKAAGGAKAPLVRFADGMGPMFDPVSKVWFDGKSHCWAGRYPWTFKAGTWSYGDYRWYEADGMWRTDAPEAPMAVDCDTVPIFAAKLNTAPAKAPGKANAEKVEETGRTVEAPKLAAKTTTDKGKAEAPAKPAECKKYFPSVGGMVSVPCE